MAARKSCTHLTWAQAKSKVGGDGRTPSSSKPSIPKKIDHGKALTAKVLAKNGASQQDIAKEKTMLRRARRGEDRAAAAASRRAEEKERQRKEMMVRPFDLARDRMILLADKLEKNNDNNIMMMNNTQCDGEDDDADVLQRMAECREMQVNEVLGLEAIYNTHHDSGHDDDDDSSTTNKEFRIAHSSKFELLQNLIEQWQVHPEKDDLLKKIVHHPPLSFTIQLTVDGIINDDYFDDGSGDGIELTAVLLLQVTLPLLYLSEDDDGDTLPIFDIEYFFCTVRDMECAPDKPLESLAHLDERGLKELLEEDARELLPDPCVYTVVTSCLVEQLFEFVKFSVQGKFILDQYLCQRAEEEE